jgi:signal peptidase I
MIMAGFTVYVTMCSRQGRVVDIAGYSIMKVVTGSMEPSVNTGDYILISRDISGLETGDIICFYSEDIDIYGKPNTHRIVRIQSDGSYVTKGDANKYEDSVTVTADKIIGKYVGKVRLLRWLNSFASGRKIMMLFVMIPLLGISIYEAVTVSRIKRQSDEEIKAAAEDERQKLIREAIDREKAKLYEENYTTDKMEVTAENESGKDTEG